MNRRDLIGGVATGAALFAIAQGASAADEHDHDHSGHDHAAHAGGGAYAKLIETANHCVATGQACLSHCLSTFVTGDTSLADCARSVHQLIAVCDALARLSSAGSSHVVEMAKLSYAVCQECEKECRKHTQHPECKACAESCAACAEECKKIVG